MDTALPAFRFKVLEPQLAEQQAILHGLVLVKLFQFCETGHFKRMRSAAKLSYESDKPKYFIRIKWISGSLDLQNTT